MNGSALHEAVMYGKVEVIKLLTQSGKFIKIFLPNRFKFSNAMILFFKCQRLEILVLRSGRRREWFL